MSFSSDTPRDNLTLSESDLAACRPIVGEGGHGLRALSPSHGSDRQRSLRVQVHSGRFVCFACGAWGYMETARAQWRAEQQRQAAFARAAARRQRASHHRQPPPRLSRPPAAAARQRSSEPPVPCTSPPERPDLAHQLAAFPAALPRRPGAPYLPLWVCEGAFDALALLAAGVPRVVAIFGVQGWRWDWTREARELVFALDADTTGQQQWRQLARQAALRGKRVAGLPAAAYGGYKD